ncbi:haloacid dehalogenase type II [Nereida sp. MMG025]|uniref:haloacid dehalogenase type II n=1 Tax=Nereida sp. MMG025 TaxID=2909981 RepID=UPI001F019BAB|nr:haloacid dehalogenase type II [Nereida sp. MMG025]MCF6445602.1 haloacid dehalogenase type II [Nereida sp. MMG025]
MTITTCIFDAYGTLFDVTAAARQAAEDPAHEGLKDVWQKLASDWRLKQLEYTWLRTIAGHHTDFWQVTQDGLDWALEAGKLTEPALRDRLLKLYWELSAYPEVPTMLRTLKDQRLNTAILSNGSRDMLDGAVQSAGIASLLDDVLSVDDVGIFKPHDRVYDMVQSRFGGTRDQILFVSSNGWDAAGAAGYGFQTVWVNRGGAPLDRLYAAPNHILPDLTTLMDLI